MTAITYAAAQMLRVLPRTRITRAMGRLADDAWPEPIRKLDEHAKDSGFVRSTNGSGKGHG